MRLEEVFFDIVYFFNYNSSTLSFKSCQFEIGHSVCGSNANAT